MNILNGEDYMNIIIKKNIVVVLFLITALGCLFTINAATASQSIPNVIIDTDMGSDDWMAITWALNQHANDKIKIIAITVCTDGEAISTADNNYKGAANASRIVDLIKRCYPQKNFNIPVYLGKPEIHSPYPIVPKNIPISKGVGSGQTFKGSGEVYNNFNFPLIIRVPATAMAISGFTTNTKDPLESTFSFVPDTTPTADQEIYNLLIGAKGVPLNSKIVILSIGTATNIAQALDYAKSKDAVSAFKMGIKMIYKGGGAFGYTCLGSKMQVPKPVNTNLSGNIPIYGCYKSNNKTAAWNIYASADAMQYILDAELPVTFVPLNISNKAPITKVNWQSIQNLGGIHHPPLAQIEEIDLTIAKLEASEKTREEELKGIIPLAKPTAETKVAPKLIVDEKTAIKGLNNNLLMEPFNNKLAAFVANDIWGSLIMPEGGWSHVAGLDYWDPSVVVTAIGYETKGNIVNSTNSYSSCVSVVTDKNQYKVTDWVPSYYKKDTAWMPGRIFEPKTVSTNTGKFDFYYGTLYLGKEGNRFQSNILMPSSMKTGSNNTFTKAFNAAFLGGLSITGNSSQ